MNTFDKIMLVLTGGLWLVMRNIYKLNPKYWFISRKETKNP